MEPERIRMVNVSAAMGGEFAISTTEMLDDLKKIGFSPLRQIGDESSTEQNPHAGMDSEFTQPLE